MGKTLVKVKEEKAFNIDHTIIVNSNSYKKMKLWKLLASQQRARTNKNLKWHNNAT
jgi:hypothetical protein